MKKEFTTLEAMNHLQNNKKDIMISAYHTLRIIEHSDMFNSFYLDGTPFLTNNDNMSLIWVIQEKRIDFKEAMKFYVKGHIIRSTVSNIKYSEYQYSDNYYRIHLVSESQIEGEWIVESE